MTDKDKTTISREAKVAEMIRDYYSSLELDRISTSQLAQKILAMLDEREVGSTRKEVSMFAKQMESKLRDNDHKEHWAGFPISDMFDKLKAEVEELSQAIGVCNCCGNKYCIVDYDSVKGEAVDVANFALMIFDIAKQHEVNSGLATKEEG